MKHFHLIALLGVAASLIAPSIVFAQDAEPPALVPMKEPAARQYIVKIKNLPSAIVAYMLDPQSNPRPAGLGAADKVDEKGTFDLPGSITEIVSVDPQNVLLIKGGSDEDFRRLKELVEILDQPQRQIEIEAQFVEMTKDDLKNFAIDFSEPQANAPQIGFGFVRNNFTARLNALIANNKAKIIWAPRVSAVNNLTATIISSVEATVDGKPATVTNIYRITPTLSGDGTITVSFKITENENNEADETGRSTIANLRNGETIALLGVISAQYRTGNRIAIVDATRLRLTDPNRVVVVFLTGRVIRNADETQK